MKTDEKELAIEDITSIDKVKERALINAAITKLKELERDIGIVRNLLEPLSGKIINVRLRSKDGRHDYTKTSLMFRKRG